MQNSVFSQESEVPEKKEKNGRRFKEDVGLGNNRRHFWRTSLHSLSFIILQLFVHYCPLPSKAAEATLLWLRSWHHAGCSWLRPALLAWENFSFLKGFCKPSPRPLSNAAAEFYTVVNICNIFVYINTVVYICICFYCCIYLYCYINIYWIYLTTLTVKKSFFCQWEWHNE